MENMKKRYSSIDIFRYICAILVVAIHTRPFEEINPSLGFIASNVIPIISVPFFFIVSGYFYIYKLKNGRQPFRHYVKRLIVLYLVWSCFYFLIDFSQWGYTNLKGFIANCFLSFFYYGSHYHFWFFPALFFALFLTTLLWKLGAEQLLIPLGVALYIIGVLGCAYFNICKNVPVLGKIISHPQFNNIRKIILTGFSFFTGGYLALKVNNKINKQQGVLIWIVSFLLWIVEIFIVVKVHLHQNIALTFGLYPLVITTLIILLQNPLPQLNNIADTSRKLASFTYYAHPAFDLFLCYL